LDAGRLEQLRGAKNDGSKKGLRRRSLKCSDSLLRHQQENYTGRPGAENAKPGKADRIKISSWVSGSEGEKKGTYREGLKEREGDSNTKGVAESNKV